MRNILFISLAFLCLVSCSTSEVEESMQANELSAETRATVPQFQEWEINGSSVSINPQAKGEIAGFWFSATGDVYLTDHLTGITYHVSDHRVNISGGPEWKLTASGHGTLFADTTVVYKGEYYQEGEVIYRIFDDDGNMIEAAVAHNGLVFVWYAY